MIRFILALLATVTLTVHAADKKITDLTSLPQSSWASGDLLYIMDLSANATKKTSVADFDARYFLGADILGIAHGGTGAATKAAGFDALSPMTTSGDLIYGGAAGTGTRLPKGSDGQILTLASGNPSWAALTNITTSLTASRAMVTGASSDLAISATTATEIGYVNGVTSAIQTQLDAKVLKSTYSAKGSILAATAASTPADLAVGTDGQVLTADAASAPGMKWATSSAAPSSSYEISNLGIATSVGSSALTIALKQADGSSDPSTGASAVKVGMRSSALTSGLYNQRSATAATSLVISSGSTLGQTSAQPANIYIYLLDNAGTLEIAASGTLYPEVGVISTTAEGGAGAADSSLVVYSTTARTNVPFRQIGVITNTQTTAGTWASAGTVLGVGNYGTLKVRNVPTVQRFLSGSGTYVTPAGVAYLKVTVVGAGGGGGGSGTGSSGGDAGTGGTSTFGSAFLTATGGAGGTDGGAGTAGGAGGTPTVNSPALAIVSLSGSAGGGYSPYNTTNTFTVGPSGGASIMGISSGGTKGAIANSGSGGGGGETSGVAAVVGNSGGGGGGIVAIINNPNTSYSYAVGAGGTAGTAGTSGNAGGTGGSGIVIVEEHYYH